MHHLDPPQNKNVLGMEIDGFVVNPEQFTKLSIGGGWVGWKR